MTEVETNKDEEDAQASSARIKKREAQAELCSQSLKGVNKKIKATQREIKEKHPQISQQPEAREEMYVIEDDNNKMERPTQQKHFDRKRAVEEARKNEYAFALAESEKQIQYQRAFLSDVKRLINKGKEETIAAVEASQKKFADDIKINQKIFEDNLLTSVNKAISSQANAQQYPPQVVYPYPPKPPQQIPQKMYQFKQNDSK